MAGRRGFARRFIAGETIDEAIRAARDIQAAGFLLTLDYLGESVSEPAAASAAAREYVHLLDVIAESGIERNVSLKLTQLGLDIGRDACLRNLRTVVEPAGRLGCFVRVDMEDSSHTQATLDIVRELWRDGARHVGIVLQSYLRRSDEDVRQAIAAGMRVRLVKGAYQEPPSVAWQRYEDVCDAFLRQMRLLLDDGVYPAIATHDEAMIEATCAYAREKRLAADRFEFQMLYGIRRDLQASLVKRGYRLRVYLPFGRQWFPYFMRRLGERPANIASVVRSLFHESRAKGSSLSD
ncbi:MAG: proline dehydrogenase [Acidimicrobiia bacterium]|nr:proline dehydrogenase [Acidimicrobiia bacterium]